MNFISIKLFAILLIIPALSMAQELPQSSPLCKVEQVVGLTNITIEYSRPGVKDRTIFGDLVPYDEIWRLGANAATTISIDQPLTIGKTVLDTGKYAMFAIPHENGKWDIIFNSNYQQWGAYGFDSSKNVLIHTVKAGTCEFKESLSITINDIGTYEGSILIEWASTSVAIPFTVDTDKTAMDNINAAIEKGEDLDKVYYKAADYFFTQKGDNKKALGYLEKSLAENKSYFNLFLKAQILYDNGDKKEAIKLGKEAAEIAVKEEKQGWADYINETVEKWSK